jgi:glycosyltransferase involved in cell wall biosynthesis
MNTATPIDTSDPRPFKLGYVASHAFRLTFEINEIAELRRQDPSARVYSFYRKQGEEIQHARLDEIDGDIVTWSPASLVAGFFYFLARKPAGLVGAFAALMWASKSNPVYWVKNTFVFAIALPLLADAHREGVTHFHADFGSSPGTIGWIGRRLLGTGLSIRYHSFDIHLDTLAYRDPLRRRKLEDADLVVAVHEDGLAHLRKQAPAASNEKFEVIRICVVFHPDTKPEHIPKPPLVLAAGNLVPAKGFDILLRAVGELAKRRFDVRLRILGEGPERGHLESLAGELGISDRTELPGYYKHGEFAGHLAQALALVVPARITKTGVREGLPTVIAESWLSSTPVIASPVGGIPEVVVDGETGLLFEVENPKGLADRIERLAADPGLQRGLAEAGRRAAVELFSPEKNVRTLVDRIRSKTRSTGTGHGP